MNERIKELMLEAGYAAPEIAGRAHKLTELLVKECIAKIALEQDSADQNWQCKNGVHIAYELQKYFEAPQ